MQLSAEDSRRLGVAVRSLQEHLTQGEIKRTGLIADQYLVETVIQNNNNTIREIELFAMVAWVNLRRYRSVGMGWWW